jgi:hypothetical protein
MKCWICEDVATTGEHMIKASDLKSMFGHVSQNAPLYIHNPIQRNLPVPGIKSNKLKFKNLLCARCNNQRTQQHDQAWEKLSNYLRKRLPPLRSGSTINLAKVFPGQVRESILNVHLYFVKLFGCMVAEHSVPLDLAPFSAAILQGHAHPNVHLSIWALSDSDAHKFAGQTPIETVQLHGQIVFATWLYYVGTIAVNVIYAVPGERRRGLLKAWHPSRVSKVLHLGGR